MAQTPGQAGAGVVWQVNPAILARPEAVARAFVQARASGPAARVLPLLDRDLAADLQQLLRDLHADDPSSPFSQNVRSAGETDPLASLLTMLFGPVDDNGLDPADQVVEVVGGLNRDADTTVVLMRIKRFVSHFPQELAFSELSAVSLARRGEGWGVLTPGGADDLKTLRALVSEGLIASRTGTVVETVQVPDPSPGTVALVSVDPPDGAVLTRDAVITAELDYRIERFEPQRFRAAVSVAQTAAGMSTMGTGAAFEQPMLATSAGRIRLLYPALAVWDDPEVKRPLEVSFCIQQLIGRLGSSVMVACTKPVTYRVATPAGRTAAPIAFAWHPGTFRPPAASVSWPDQQQASASPTDTPESVARRFLEAAAAGDMEQCVALLDPEAVRLFVADLRKTGAELAPPAVADRLSSLSDTMAASLLVLVALGGAGHDPTDASIEVLGTVTDSPTSSFVVYRSRHDQAHSGRLPISSLRAVRLAQQEGTWRVTTPSGETDATTFVASMRIVMAAASVAAEVEKLAPTPPPAGGSGTDVVPAEEAAVRAAAAAWRQAKLRHDIAALDRLMTADFLEVNQTGDRVNRAQLLSRFRSADLVFADIGLEHMVVEIAGNRARVTGVHTETVKYRDRDVGGRLAFTEIYVNTGGQWQIMRSALKQLR